MSMNELVIVVTRADGERVTYRSVREFAARVRKDGDRVSEWREGEGARYWVGEIRETLARAVDPMKADARRSRVIADTDDGDVTAVDVGVDVGVGVDAVSKARGLRDAMEREAER